MRDFSELRSANREPNDNHFRQLLPPEEERHKNVIRIARSDASTLIASHPLVNDRTRFALDGGRLLFKIPNGDCPATSGTLPVRPGCDSVERPSKAQEFIFVGQVQDPADTDGPEQVVRLVRGTHVQVVHAEIGQNLRQPLMEFVLDCRVQLVEQCGFDSLESRGVHEEFLPEGGVSRLRLWRLFASTFPRQKLCDGLAYFLHIERLVKNEVS